jgi:uncharacterized repeat protein (TIGR03847 family)
VKEKMPDFVYDLDPISFITVGTVGPQGQRIFCLQASQGATVVTLIIEKEQARALAESLNQLLKAVEEHYPQLPKPAEEVTYNMSLLQPFNELWRVGQMGLGYDEKSDLVVLISQELIFEEDEPREPEAVRFTGTRDQMLALSKHTAWIVEQGRPICPLCDRPIDPEGHFCPPSNGHHRVVEL